MASQISGDLRHVVARAVGQGARVVVLVADQALESLLRANGCQVSVDPPSLEALADAPPQVIVAFDGALRDGPKVLELIARAAPAARLVLSFGNAVSSTALLAALAEGHGGKGASLHEVTGWLNAAGYTIDAATPVVMPRERVPLAPELEASLRAVFEQLNAQAAVDRYVVSARRGVAQRPVEPEVGLLSVVIARGAEAPQGTLGSLGRQLVRGLELVYVTDEAAAVADAAMAPAKGRAGFTTVGVSTPGVVDVHAQLNAGLERARGQYVALVRAGDLFEPTHLKGLRQALDDSTAAWAVVPSAAAPTGPFDVRRWVEAKEVRPAAWLLDRLRLGKLSLNLPAGVPQAELVLFLRLAALLSPAVVAGADTVSPGSAVDVALEPLEPMWRTRPWTSLVPFVRRLERPTEPPTPEPPRLSALLRERLEQVHPTAAKAFDVVHRTVRRVEWAAKQAQEDAAKERAD